MKQNTRQYPRPKTDRWLVLLSTAAWLLFAPIASARTSEPAARPKGRKFHEAILAKNQWRMTVTNYGSFGHDATRNSSGGEWPRGSGNMYIYGAGIWFGRRQKTATGTDTNVTVGYNPNSGKAEFTPGAMANAGSGYSSREFERVYLYPEDWPPDPTLFPAGMQDSWRTSLKVPPASGTDTIFGWFSPIPRRATSTGDAWSVFCDGDVQNMEQPSRAKSCSIEVYQYTYCWSLPWNRDVVFFVCNVKNVGHDTIKDAYMAMVCDGDIGGANNDYAGLLLRKFIHKADFSDSIWVDNVGMEWSDAEGWPTFPGVMGFDFLQSPYKRDSLGRVPGIDGIDNDSNGMIDEPKEGEQIGMTAYKIFTLQSGDPAGDGNQYEAMQGKRWTENPPPYEPFDSLDNTPADKRFLQASGPFSVPPDSMVTLTIGIIAAPLSHLPSDRDTSFWALAVSDRAAQQAYDNNWISPVPPPSPNFTLLPGDGRITVMWDNSPEQFPDPFYPFSRPLKSPFYAEKDFQGYKVYRSQSGRIGDWTLLGQYDKRDGIVFEDDQVAESIRSKATDNGLAYAYVDSVNVRNGFAYYYAVTAFDYNTLGGDPTPADTSHLTSESGMLPLAISTRTQPTNYLPPWDSSRQTAGNPDIRAGITTTVIAPHAVKADTFLVRFTEPTRSDSFTVYGMALLRANGDTVSPLQTFRLMPRKFSDTVTLTATVFDSVEKRVYHDTLKNDTLRSRAWLPVLSVMVKVKLDSTPARIYDSVHVVNGPYNLKFGFTPLITGTFYTNFLWPYRGNDYRIVWQLNGSSQLVPEVLDLDAGELVPFRLCTLPPYSHPQPESAGGWCLYDSVPNNPVKRKPTGFLTLGKTKSMYVNGGLFDLNIRNDTVLPISVLPNPGDTWILYSMPYTPVPCLATYNLVTGPMELRQAAMTLNVKVVPNPYLVRNEWERHPDFRKLKFINLPSSCKIRIYTLAGDLIQTLTHEATNARTGSISGQQGGDEDWDLLSAAGQKPAPGIYIFHVDSPNGTQVGKFAIVY
jgi:hypothetical protein